MSSVPVSLPYTTLSGASAGIFEAGTELCLRLRLRHRNRPSTTSAITAAPPIDAPIAACAPVDNPPEPEPESEDEDEASEGSAVMVAGEFTVAVGS